MADRSKHKDGKYRRFIFISVLSVFLTRILIFMKVDFGFVGTYIYYVIVAILYYTAYTVFNIPYMALGSSLTSNDLEKTKLSAVRQSFGFIGILFAGGAPSVLIDLFHSSGFDDSKSYLFTAAFLAVCSAVTILITWKSTMGSGLTFPSKERKKSELISVIQNIFKCKPYVLLIVSALFFYFGFNMIASSIIFVITGILGLTEGAAGLVFLVLSLTGVAISFLLAKISEKYDKKSVYMVAVFLTTVCMFAMRFIGINSLIVFIAYIVILNFSISAFLVFIYNFLYDVIDIINFKADSRDGGAIFSYYSFIVKIGKAGAVQLVGILLAVGGYDAELAVQTPECMAVILNNITLYPALFFLASVLVLSFYPVTRKRIEALKEAMMKKTTRPTLFNRRI